MSIRCTTSKFGVSRSSEMACYESSPHLFALGPMIFVSQDGLLILICRSASKRANLVILVFYFNLPAELCYVFVALQIFYCPIGVFCILGWRCTHPIPPLVSPLHQPNTERVSSVQYYSMASLQLLFARKGQPSC